MASIKPITKADLIVALKELRKQIADDIFESQAEFFQGMIKPEIDGLGKGIREEMKAGFAEVNTRLAKLENEVSWIKDDIKGIKADLSNTPTLKEFNELKTDVQLLRAHN